MVPNALALPNLPGYVTVPVLNLVLNFFRFEDSNSLDRVAAFIALTPDNDERTKRTEQNL